MQNGSYHSLCDKITRGGMCCKILRRDEVALDCESVIFQT